ncbi:MAG: hypothetical protein K0S11_1016 [Gammaproteobacteria bacterium]|nr:hypothetical protein [Gammaproteobacteria bacterium]
MADKLANLVYILVAIFTVLVIHWSAPAVIYKPKGMVLPVKEHLIPGKTSQVEVYAGISPGVFYQTLATIHVQSRYNPVNEQATAEAMQDYAKGLAANVGANGLVLIQMASDPSTKTFFLNAKAIK